MEEYPYYEICNYVTEDTYHMLKQDSFHVFYLSKGDFFESDYTGSNDDEEVFIKNRIPHPTKIIMFKTKIVPNALAINKQIWG